MNLKSPLSEDCFMTVWRHANSLIPRQQRRYSTITRPGWHYQLANIANPPCLLLPLHFKSLSGCKVGKMRIWGTLSKFQPSTYWLEKKSVHFLQSPITTSRETNPSPSQHTLVIVVKKLNCCLTGKAFFVSSICICYEQLQISLMLMFMGWHLAVPEHYRKFSIFWSWKSQRNDHTHCQIHSSSFLMATIRMWSRYNLTMDI